MHDLVMQDMLKTVCTSNSVSGLVSKFVIYFLQSDSSVDGTYSLPLLFEKLPEINQDGSQWTDCEIRDAINSVYQNLQKLDAYISVLVRALLFCSHFGFWRK